MRVVVSTMARAAAAALCCAALTASASAQPATPMATPTPVPPDSGPVRQLTVDEAVRLALEQNLSLRVERINPQIEDQNVLSARTAWAPTLNGNFFYNSTDTPPDSFLSGSQGTLKTDYYTGTTTIQQLLPWGTTYSLGWDARRSTTNSIFNTFDPTIRSNLDISVTQPLLRNFAVDSARQQLIVSRRNREISDEQLRGSVVSTVRNVKNAYWDLKYALANLEVQRQSLDLARQTLRDNRTRVEVGTMAPIDIVEAEAEVARNEENVIVAEAVIRQAEDQLRALILDPQTPDFWTMRIDPIDPAQLQQAPVDANAAVQNALSRRADLSRARLSQQNVESNLTYYRNQTLPQVNLQVDYGATGLGGTEFQRVPGFPPGPVIPGTEINRGLGTVLGDVFGSQYPSWQFGVVVSYPLGRSAAHTNYARSQLELNQARLQIQSLELQVATQVRDIARQVNTNSQRVDATRATRVLAERRLEAEQKKFSVGTSTSFLVFQAQRDLATARVNELRAILDYNQSLADFEAVQETAITGGGISIAGASTVNTGGGASAASASAQSAASNQNRR